MLCQAVPSSALHSVVCILELNAIKSIHLPKISAEEHENIFKEKRYALY